MIQKKESMKYLLALLVVFTTVNLNAQVDQKAKSILDEVSKKTQSSNSITADFQFIMENSEVDLHESNEGSLIIQKDSYKLNFNGIEVMCDGKSQWTYMPDAEEVNVSEANSGEDGMLNPATIFTIYEEGFVNTYLGEFTESSVKIFKIDMVPTEEQEFSRVILDISQTNYQIAGATMFGTDGNKYIIKVKNMITNKKYPESTFAFDSSKYPGVEVIDMR